MLRNLCFLYKNLKLDALKLLKLPNDYFSKLEGSSLTMIRPNKCLVGVNVDTERNEVPDEEESTARAEDDAANDDEITENMVYLDVEEAITEEDVTDISASLTVELNGNQVHKATVIRELFESAKESNDRLNISK